MHWDAWLEHSTANKSLLWWHRHWMIAEVKVHPFTPFYKVHPFTSLYKDLPICDFYP